MASWQASFECLTQCTARVLATARQVSRPSAGASASAALAGAEGDSQFAQVLGVSHSSADCVELEPAAAHATASGATLAGHADAGGGSGPAAASAGGNQPMPEVCVEHAPRAEWA